MAETVAGIIVTASTNLNRENEELPTTPLVFDRIEVPSEEPQLPPLGSKQYVLRRLGNSAGKKKKKTAPSPGFLAAACSKKRNLHRLSPASHGFPFASPVNLQRSRQTPRRTKSKQASKTSTAGEGSSNQDFPIPRPPLP